MPRQIWIRGCRCCTGSTHDAILRNVVLVYLLIDRWKVMTTNTENIDSFARKKTVFLFRHWKKAGSWSQVEGSKAIV